MKNSNNIIHVIGGSGFIGTELCKILSKKKNFFSILDIKKSLLFPKNYKKLNVCEVGDLNREICNNSIIVNLAAEHRDNVSPVSLYYNVNVDGASNICKIAEKKNVKKIIFTSSVAVYGFSEFELNESSDKRPDSHYGISKSKAEDIFIEWQKVEPQERVLVIIRPTVVFGEGNRGNVFNLFKYLASRKFLMVGKGNNKKSIAYVSNVAEFISYSIKFKSGIHIFNYVDKPDLTMIELIKKVKKILGHPNTLNFSLPINFAIFIGRTFDLASFVFKIKLNISSLRIKKFCANTVYKSSVSKTGFVPPFSLDSAIKKTIIYEFVEKHEKKQLFFSE